MTGKRMLIDTSKCIGCKACQIACQQWHSLSAEDTAFTGSYTNPPDLSGANLTLIKFFEIEKNGSVQFHFVTERCRHCEYPNCLLSCPLGAIKKKNNGMVFIDLTKCIPEGPGACTDQPYPAKRPCQLGCPFKVSGDGLGIPRLKYMKDGSLTGDKMKKCDFCYNRFGNQGASLGLPPKGAFAKSRLPACEVTCAPGAIKSGKAKAMLNKANKRVTYLKANGYPNANVYPNQNGIPTHVIWVLLENPTVYGMPIL
jgi:formate dehydrogenase iron-sulfur subunit